MDNRSDIANNSSEDKGLGAILWNELATGGSNTPLRRPGCSLRKED